MPGTGGRIYFANEYIQFPNCTGAAFTLTDRDLRRDQGRHRQLGNLGQLRHPITQSAANNGCRTSQAMRGAASYARDMTAPGQRPMPFAADNRLHW